jgi:hypothetical protein
MLLSPLPPPNAGPMRLSESDRARRVFLHTIAGLFVGMLTSCAPQRSEPEQPLPQLEQEEISTSRCVPFTGDDRDPSLRGSPRTEPPSCCESSYGFDPLLAARSCELAEYLGESEELACVHRFLDHRGFLHELRVTPIFGLELDAAIALHESGEFDETHTADWLTEPKNAWLSQTPARRWALVSGWSATRRLTWTPEACDNEAMLPVILAMADAPEQGDIQTPLPRFSFDEHVPTSGSLLDQYARVSGEPGRHPLPDRATALVEASLHAAAHERLEDFVAHLHADARWGLPDRRELAGRPILADRGVAAMAALRRSAARLPEGLALHCPELDRRTVPLVRRGEATMWCIWVSDNHLDVLVFALRGRSDAGDADAKISYIGLFPDAPLGPVIVPGEPPPPPVRARPPIICGDPHAVDYPGLCPDADALEDDEESEDLSSPRPAQSPNPPGSVQPPELSDSASGSGG